MELGVPVKLRQNKQDSSQPSYRTEDTKSMQSQYVELEEDVYRVAHTRISLDSLVYAYLNGQTAEAIAQSFPLLTLEQVYGALAYYLAHKEQIDANLARGQQELARLRQAARDADPSWYRKLEEARRSAA